MGGSQTQPFCGEAHNGSAAVGSAQFRAPVRYGVLLWCTTLCCCAVPVLLCSCCRPAELEQLVCGGRVVDLSALESATHYQDGYHRDSKPVCWFWEVRAAACDAPALCCALACQGQHRLHVTCWTSPAGQSPKQSRTMPCFGASLGKVACTEHLQPVLECAHPRMTHPVFTLPPPQTPPPLLLSPAFSNPRRWSTPWTRPSRSVCCSS